MFVIRQRQITRLLVRVVRDRGQRGELNFIGAADDAAPKPDCTRREWDAIERAKAVLGAGPLVATPPPRRSR